MEPHGVLTLYFVGAEDIAETDGILELMQKFYTVRPVCVPCYESGKRPLPKNVKAIKKPKLL